MQHYRNISKPIVNLTDDVAIFIGIFCPLSCIATMGNLFILITIYTTKALHTPTYRLLANIAIADIISAISVFLYSSILGIFQTLDWPLSSLRIVCKLLVPSLLATYISSTQTLVVMSMERYRAVIYPHRKLYKNKNLCLIILINWMVGIAISIPSINIVTAVPQMHLPCEILHHNNSIFNRLYVATLIFTQYIVPLIIMFYAYGFIIKKLRGHSCTNCKNQVVPVNKLKHHTIASIMPHVNVPIHQSQTCQTIQRGKYTTNVIQMAVLVTIAFMLFSMPWTIVLAWIAFRGRSLSSIYARTQGDLIYLLHFSQASFLLTSLYNPILYCYCNHHFRKQLRRLYRRMHLNVIYTIYRRIIYRSRASSILDDDAEVSISSRCGITSVKMASVRHGSIPRP